MKNIAPLIPWVLVLACTPPDDTDEPTQTDDTVSQIDETGSAQDTSGEEEEEVEAHPLGEPMADFSLMDINPSSPSYGQSIDSETLAGTAYSIIFLDSRCITCVDVIEDMWAELEERSAWKEGLPLYAIQSVGGAAQEKTLERMIEGHDMPYLQDTEETLLWQSYEALNHDFFAVSPEGTLDAWLPLYVWPDDLEDYQAYMEGRFGP